MTNAITSPIAAPGGTSASGAAANTQITALSAGSLTRPGTYEFSIQMGAVAAGAAADFNNVLFVVGASSYPVPFTPAAGPQSPVKVKAVLDGSTGVSVTTGTAVSTIAYYGSISAEYLGPAGSNLLHR